MIKDKQLKEKIGIETRQDILENPRKPVYLGIGSNVGNRINNIKINSYMFENDKFDESINNEIEKANYILISIPPVNGEDLVSKKRGQVQLCL